MEIKFKKVIKGNSDKRILLTEKYKDYITLKEYVELTFNEYKKDNIKLAKAKKGLVNSIVEMQNKNAMDSIEESEVKTIRTKTNDNPGEFFNG